MKTIIYVGGFELPDKNAAAHRVLSIGKILRALGYNVVFIGVNKMLFQSSHIKDSRTEIEGFDAWSVPYPNSKITWMKNISAINPIKYVIENHYQNNLHSVICYNHPFLSQYRIKQLCMKKGAFYLADVTEWYEVRKGSVIFKVIKWLDVTLRMRYMHCKADGVITTSKYLTEYYARRGAETLELPTLYDPVFLNKPVATFKNGNKGVIKFIYAGSPFDSSAKDIDRKKIKDRLDKIIVLFSRVFRHSENFELNIYGLSLQNYLSVFPEHERILDETGSNIIFHGIVSHKKVIQETMGSDFSIFLREIKRAVEAGFPSKFSESISCGTPVICNKISNIEDFIVEKKNAFVLKFDDVDDQVENITKILNLDKKKVSEMKEYCRRSDTFDFRQYLGQTIFFLESLEDNLDQRVV